MSTRSATESWRLMRDRGHGADGIEVPSVLSGIDADDGPVRFALGSRGEGRLLLPVSASERVPAIPETPTLRILDEIYSFEGKSWRFLDLTCLAPELDGVFGEVADEIVTRLSEGHSALKACTTTLGEFRMLLVPRQSKVGKKDIVGLLGEMLLLDELLELDTDACHLWRGPISERHDFRGGSLSAEVKTSGRAGNEMLEVTSIDQLLEPEGGELCLVRYTLEEVAGGELSIASLFDRIVRKASDPLQLRDLLARMECPDPRSPDWNSIHFALEERRSYRIDEFFPRLVPGSLVAGGLPTGVGQVCYVIDLAAARGALLSFEEHRSFLEGMVACLPA